MKKLSLVLSLVLFTVGFALAQRTVTGTITDDGGEPLIGASILVKGTTTGTVTDIDGTYKIDIPTNDPAIFVVSYTGFETREIEVGVSSQLDITMSEGVALDEVVVTGLGIRRDKKALGYAVTTLESDALELRPEADVARVLRGKVPGVDISATSGLAGAGTNVIIRGYTSITGTNQPLFVVDGVPFNSETNADRGSRDADGVLAGVAAASSRFLDLDPNNIAEVSVLKGLSATVLYGEAGRNGVILVTTKNGKAGDIDKKFEVTLDQSFFANQIASLPDDQDAYGNGFWNNPSAAFSNWGGPFSPGVHTGALQRAYDARIAAGSDAYNPADGTIPHPYSVTNFADDFPEFAGTRYDYRAYDNLQNFFETGLISNTSLNISNRINDGTAVNFSYGYRDEAGFVPSSNFEKHNFGLGFSTQMDNGLKINSTFNYVTSDRTAPPLAASTSSNPNGTDNSSLFSNVFYTPRSIDLMGLPYVNPVDNTHVYYRGNNGIQNPRWTLENAFDQEAVRRFFGQIALSYQLAPWLSANYRIGLDGFSQRQRYGINKNAFGQVPLGVLQTSSRTNLIQDHTLNLQYNTQLSDDWTLDGVVGLNVRRDVFDVTYADSEQQFVYGLLRHDNFIAHVNESETREETLAGVYATAALGYKNYLYASVQARNDWTSTLEPDNRSILYPSASLSFIPTDAFAGLQNNNTLNYLKLRVGFGTSAGYPNPYRTRTILGTNTQEFTTQGGSVLNTNTVDDVFANPNLTPERHTEVELGIEARLFRNRVSVDLSLYNKDSEDLIIDLDLDPATGFEETTVNAASINNKGIELGLNVTAIQTSNFTLGGFLNFTRNVGVVESLAPGLEQFAIESIFTDLGNYAIPGEPYGVIQGNRIQRDEATGERVTSGGLYVTDPDLTILGDPNPRYQLNYGLNFNFKGLAFNALMTYSDGGVVWATLPSTLMGRGILQETDFDRFVPVIAPGVKADGTPNDVQITSTDHYWRNGGVFQDEMRTYDATFLKLREISLSYALPSSFLEKSPFGAISFTLSGQNLWFRAFGVPKGANFDPEVSAAGVGNSRGFELMNVPTSKQFGGSVRITF